MRRLTLVAVALAAVLGLAVVATGAAQGEATVRVEVRVWQSVEDGREIHIGARPADGLWQTLGRIPLALDDGFSPRGWYRYGDISVDIRLPNRSSPLIVEVRVWQDVRDDQNIYISARDSLGEWDTLGTVRLPLDEGLSFDRQWRFGDISLGVPLQEARVTTLAGHPDLRGYEDGQGEEALFGRSFFGLGIEGDRDGSVVVADSENHAIRRILPDGTVTTIAGGNGEGVRDGPAATAQFAGPEDVAIAPDGSIYVADRDAHRIRKIAPDGMVTTVAGGGPIAGLSNDAAAWGDFRDGPAEEARFSFPHGIVIDQYGDLYVAEDYQRIRRVSPAGWVSTFAGSSRLGYRDGPAGRARFFEILAIAIDSSGTIYVVEGTDSLAGPGIAVRTVTADGLVSTLFRETDQVSGLTLGHPRGLAVTSDGVIYIANTGRHQLVRLTSDGELRAVAGTGDRAYADGPLDGAAFDRPGGIAIMDDGSLVVADEGNGVIRRITLGRNRLGTPGLRLAGDLGIPRMQGVTVSIFAGKAGPKVEGEPRFRDGPSREALFDQPWAMALDTDGNVIVADSGNHAIRRIAPDGTVTTIAGGQGEGSRDGPCDEAQFARPQGVAVAEDGSIYLADSRANRIRRIGPDCAVTTVAGGGSLAAEGQWGGYRDGLAAEARFRDPAALAFDHEGNLLIAERGNSLVRLLSPDGEVSTVAGGRFVPSPEKRPAWVGSVDGPGDRALFFSPEGIAVDGEGNIFFTERWNPIRAIDGNGFVSTVLRTPRNPYGGALSPSIAGIAVGHDGALFVADQDYGRVVRVTRDGVLSVVAEGLGKPQGIVATAAGALLVTDIGDNVIWKITFEDGAE